MKALKTFKDITGNMVRAGDEVNYDDSIVKQYVRNGLIEESKTQPKETKPATVKVNKKLKNET